MVRERLVRPAVAGLVEGEGEVVEVCSSLLSLLATRLGPLLRLAGYPRGAGTSLQAFHWVHNSYWSEVGHLVTCSPGHLVT